MAQLENIESGVVFTTSVTPVWIGGIWECGDQRFTDSLQTLYRVPTSYPLLTPMQFYDALTPQEETAILSSADPLVQTFARRLARALQTNAPIDPNLATVQEGLAYLSVTNQLSGATPAATYILPARIPQILAGIAQ